MSIKENESMKKYIAIILLLVLAVTMFTACVEPTPTPTPTPTPVDVKLDAPTGLVISLDALISWKAVENATSYVLTINGHEYTTESTSYQADKKLDFTVSVVAKGGKGYLDSDSSVEKKYVSPYKDEPIIIPEDVVIAIEGGTQINSKGTLQLKATVSGTDNTAVTWEVVEGENYVKIDEKGLITASEVDGDKTVVIKCTSKANENVSATKVLNIRARTELTQSMLDEIASKDVMAFVGFLSIDLYTIGINPKHYMTYSTVVNTAMDGTNWYAEYESDSIKQSLYYRNYEGYANQVGLSFMNDELYNPMLDENESKVTWQDAGLYNNFKGLSVSDFTFDEEEWRWVYTGSNDTLKNKVVASACPYDFDPKSVSLIIDSGEIIGVYSISEVTYTLVTNYSAVQELFVAIDSGDTVEVPTIGKYSHEDIHDDLAVAIENMKSLDSYVLTSKEIISSIYTSSYTLTGYVEKITNEMCHFEPFTYKYDTQGNEVRTPTENASYGYKKFASGYNAYYENKDGTFSPSRAYNTSFDHARPTFAFASEIFRSYVINEEEGTTTYYVDDLMNGVASTFYYGVGNDVQLYGIFATRGYVSSSSSFTPYVTVKDGYIIEAGFYFYLGSMSGVIELYYSDFNSVESVTDKDVSFTERVAPSSWSELTINVTDVGDTDTEENALETLKTFFSDENIEENMPFFQSVLGDCYGFGMTTYRIGADKKNHRTIAFYYDVPLDVDYTINSSIEKIENLLIAEGYTKNADGVYIKGNIAVQPYDQDLDFIVYVWINK